MQFVIVNGPQSKAEEKVYLRAVKSYSGILTVEISLTEDFADTNQLLTVTEEDGKLHVVTHSNFAEEYLPYVAIDPDDDEVEGHIRVQKN
jgi:hypothetical protein